VTPVTLITLANLGRPRRPAGTTAAAAEPVLPDPATATRQLAPLTAGPVTEADLPSLRDVQRFAGQAAQALLGGQAPDCDGLNSLAAASTACTELGVTGGRLHARLVWRDATPGAGLARRLIEELAELDPGRLRCCARPACSLLFYDTTRSRTRRWHAENPCGWRERQHHRRTQP
jgi:predicted RNA-binding Zn ribbon-like protein